jgi:hypothetical protein
VTPAATVITLTIVRPRSAPIDGNRLAAALLPAESVLELPVDLPPEAVPELLEPPDGAGVAEPSVTVLLPETARMPFEMVETVWQFEDDGVNAAVVGVTVVPTVYGTGVPLEV